MLISLVNYLHLDFRNVGMEEMWHIFIQSLLRNPCGRDYIHILPSISQISSGQSPVRYNCATSGLRQVKASVLLHLFLSCVNYNAGHILRRYLHNMEGIWSITDPHWTLCEQNRNLCCVKPLRDM